MPRSLHRKATFMLVSTTPCIGYVVCKAGEASFGRREGCQMYDLLSGLTSGTGRIVSCAWRTFSNCEVGEYIISVPTCGIVACHVGHHSIVPFPSMDQSAQFRSETSCEWDQGECGMDTLAM
jgi:hypothetical protein